MPDQTEFRWWEEDGDDVFDRLFEHVVNGPFARYRDVRQYGIRAGTTLWSHVLNGMFMVQSLRSVLRLADDERTVLLLAVLVHDMNKFAEEHHERGFNAVATTEAIAGQLESLGVGKAVPGWREWLGDISQLVREHSAHLGPRSIAGSAVEPRLPRERRRALVQVIQAIDASDLYRSFDSAGENDKFLSPLNAVTDTQYALVGHRLDEYRGVLSNIIHNTVAETLRAKWDAHPVFLFPEGTWYLVPRDRMPRNGVAADLGAVVAERVRQRLLGNPADLVEAKPAGIKIVPEAASLGADPIALVGVIDAIIQKRGDRDLATDEEKARARTGGKREAASEDVRRHIDHWIAGERVIPSTQEGYRLGELVKAWFIFLNDQAKPHLGALVDEGEDAPSDVWGYLYHRLGVEEPALEALDPRYDRPFAVARMTSRSYEDVLTGFKADARRIFALARATDVTGSADTDPVAAYVRDHLTLTSDRPDRREFAAHLRRYVADAHRQCPHCSSRFSTIEWMSADVPAGIKVQMFSNRLRGGKTEPKRNICPICRLDFKMQDIAFKAAGDKAIYLHLFPRGFLTDAFLVGLRRGIARALTEGAVSVRLDLAAAIAACREGQPVILAGTPAGGSGWPLPRYSEAWGNVISQPINPLGANYTERYLSVLEYAVVFGKAFDCRVLLSESAVPPIMLAGDEAPELYLDALPTNLRGLVRENAFDADAVDRLTGDLGDLRELSSRLYSPKLKENLQVTLALGLARGPLRLYFEVDRLAERGGRHGVARIAVPIIERFLERGSAVERRSSEIMCALAALGWSGGIRNPNSLVRNSLLLPMNMLFDHLRRQKGYLDMETVEDSATQLIFDHIERISPYQIGRTKLGQIAQFTAQFFHDLLEGVYGGNVDHLLRDEKNIKAAYLLNVQRQIPQKKEVENEPA